MWLQNVDNGRYYPYTEFLAQAPSMIVVYQNPFNTPTKPVEEQPVEKEEEIVYDEVSNTEEITEEEIIAEEVLTPKPAVKRVAKPALKKGKPKK